MFFRAHADYATAVEEPDGRPDLFERKGCNLITEIFEVIIRIQNHIIKSSWR